MDGRTDRQEIDVGDNIDCCQSPVQGGHRQAKSSEAEVANATWALTASLEPDVAPALGALEVGVGTDVGCTILLLDAS